MKYFLLLSLSVLGLVFAYSQTDVEVANSLANKGMIVDQSVNSSNYRLDANILRQEVIGMALKLKGINLPDNYSCKRYFLDATKNDWVCRAAELAADNGIITRTNKNVRPTDYITKSEALAIIVNAGGVSYPKNVTSSDYPASTAQWQIDIIEGAVNNGILDTSTGFSYNKNALRKEVFQFLYSVLSVKGDISEPVTTQLTSEDTASIIEQHCQSDWPNDFSMKAYCIKQQQSGLAELGQGKPADISESYFSMIRTKCKADWTTDFSMRAYCEKQQYEAVRALAKGKPSDITQKEFDIIRPKCEKDWSTDFTMRVYCEKQQYEGVRELRN